MERLCVRCLQVRGLVPLPLSRTVRLNNAAKSEVDIDGRPSTDSPNLSDWFSYHRLLVDDIKYAKSQQWRLAYYTLLLLAAIIGLSKILGSDPAVKIILFITSVVLAFASTHFLWKFQKDLTRYRQNISKVREKLPDALQDIAKFEPTEGDPTYYADFLHLLIGAIWVAIIFVAWTIKFLDLIFCVSFNCEDMSYQF